jgi:hypothetical protein
MKDFEAQEGVRLLNEFRNELRQACLRHGYDEDRTVQFVARTIEYITTEHPSRFLREETSKALAEEKNNEV